MIDHKKNTHFFKRHAHFLAEVLVVIALLLVAFSKSKSYLDKNGLGDFYSSSYSPAAILGQRGVFPFYYKNKSIKLDKFLNKEINEIDPDDERQLEIVPWQQQDLNGVFTYYLQLTVGSLWRIFGTNWEVVKSFSIALWLASIFSIYLLGKVLIGPIAGTIAAFLCSLDSSILTPLPEIRDFSKIFFLFSGMALIYWLFFKTKSRLQFFLGNIAFSALVAFGIGFRTDTKALLPLYILALLLSIIFFRRAAQKKSTIFGGAVLMCCSFILFSQPEKEFRNSYHSAHVAILGQTPPFSINSYSTNHSLWIGEEYIDTLADQVISFKSQQLGLTSRYFDSNYERAGLIYLTNYILDMPYRFYKNISDIPKRLFTKKELLLILSSFILIAFVRPHTSAYMLLSFVFLSSLLWVQFGQRHYFHMDVFLHLATGSVAFFVLDSFKKRKKLIERIKLRCPRTKTIFAYFSAMLLLALFITGIGSTLKSYEHKKVEQIVSDYSELPVRFVINYKDGNSIDLKEVQNILSHEPNSGFILMIVLKPFTEPLTEPQFMRLLYDNKVKDYYNYPNKNISVTPSHASEYTVHFIPLYPQNNSTHYQVVKMEFSEQLHKNVEKFILLDMTDYEGNIYHVRGHNLAD